MNLSFAARQRPYIIAEIGANHNGDMTLARKMIETAKEIGCDAVKFQSWDKGLFAKVVYDENKFLGDDYRNRKDHTLETVIGEFAIAPAEMQELADYCRKTGIDFSTTPFSPEQVDECIHFGAPFIKIASMDIVSDYLLRHAARTGRPIVLSTGFATLEEIDHAVHTIEAEGNRDLTILHCLGLYPPPDEAVNLANMEMLREAFGYPVGFSDHTLGTEISLAAFARGAVLLEKHFTLDKEMFGWDHKISADVPEMMTICKGRDRIQAAIGTTRRTLTDTERNRSVEFRRSIVAGRDIRAGEVIRGADISYRRPGRGIAPNHDALVIGRIARHAIPADTLIAWSDLEAVSE